MGLFDKLKSAVNFVTGGGAVVKITPANAVYDGTSPVKVKVSAQIKDAPLNAKKIYLQVRSQERVQFKEKQDGKEVTISKSHTSYEHTLDFAGGQTLEANKSYEWDTEFTLPAQIPGSVDGTLFNHVWEVMAGIDVSGNDPDSGWVQIKIKR